jgi:hypothetical protein
MMARGERPDKRQGPPDEKTAPPVSRGRPHSSPTPTPATAKKQKPGQQHCMPGRRRVGLYASGWRDGFKAGAADALRVAGRHLPAETWPVVEALASEYDLAGGDG